MNDDAATSLLRETVDSWQNEYAQTLTDHDAREILTNVCAYFDLLDKWASGNRSALPR